MKATIITLALMATGAQAAVQVATALPRSVFTIVNSSGQNMAFDVDYTIYMENLGDLFGKPTTTTEEAKAFTINLGSGGEFIWRIDQNKACLRSVRINGGPNILEPVAACLEAVTIRILPPLRAGEPNGVPNVEIIRSSPF